jgi:hypothetical protein
MPAVKEKSSDEDWRMQLEAARRKIAVASYHVDCLGDALKVGGIPRRSAPPIPIQAHFEGVIVSVMAAVDQVAQAANSGLQLHLSPARLFEGAFGRLGKLCPEIQTWVANPIGPDLRRIRTRIVHYSYKKTPQGLFWVVESADSAYTGSRELLDYATSALDFGKRMIEMLPQIEIEIAREQKREVLSSKQDPV